MSGEGVGRNGRLLLSLLASRLTLNPTQVSLYRAGVDDFLVYVPIVSGEANYAVFRLHRFSMPLGGWGFASNCWHLYGWQVREASGTVRTLTAQNSAWEYAYTIGVADDPSGAANWDFFGSVHQAQAQLTWSLKMDGVEHKNLVVGQCVLGAEVVCRQTMSTYLPKDKTTVIGASTLVQTFNLAQQCLVDHSHTYGAGYQIYAAYSAMMPTTNGDSEGIDTYQVGGNPAAARVYDGNAKNLNTETDTQMGSHSIAHAWKCNLFLPYGGPDINGDWSQAGGYKAWFHDLADVEKGKFYVNWVSSNYADRVSAAASSHQTRYFIST